MRAFRLALMVSVFVVAIAMAGCGGEESAPASRGGGSDQPVQQQEPEKPDSQERALALSPEAQSMIESVSNYINHTKTKINSLDTNMQKLAAKAEEKGEEMKAEYDKIKAEWDAKLKEVKTELDQLASQARTAPGTVKQKVQKVFIDLKERYEEAAQKFN